jgi:hypothetical protein
MWENKSAEQLLREQQVKPISKISDLAGDWPTDDSLDEFLEGVRKGRH